MRSLFALLLLLAACRTPPLDFGDGGGEPGADLAGPSVRRDMAVPRDLHSIPTSCCGIPGNPGNELGVGKFCQTSMDCSGLKASICASTFAPNLTFCTLPCTMGGGNAQCGSGATCQCGGANQCACVPGECLMPPPGC
jgi:hypothetical protein